MIMVFMCLFRGRRPAFAVMIKVYWHVCFFRYLGFAERTLSFWVMGRQFSHLTTDFRWFWKWCSFLVMVILSYFWFPCLKLSQLSTSFTQGVPENLLHQSRTAWCKISMWFVHTTNVVPVVSQIAERSKSWKNASKIQIGFIVLQSLHGFLLPLIKTLHELQIAKESQAKHQ